MKIKQLIWDSNIFKIKIANLKIGTAFVDMAEVDSYIRENKIQLCQCCLDISNRKNIRTLAKNGFEFVDLKMIFKLKPCLCPGVSKVQKAKKEDIESLKKIASEVFYAKSRFNNQNIAKNRVNKFYQTWAEKAVLGTFDNSCYLVKAGSEIAGFVTYKNSYESKAAIGLIGVSKRHQGKNIGSALMAKVITEAHKEGKKYLEVATEGSNIAAQNFYIRNGFKISQIKAWYYKWTDHH